VPLMPAAGRAPRYGVRAAAAARYSSLPSNVRRYPIGIA
jgi:hypothetical protein